MVDIQLLITFIVTSALFAFLPGPAMLYAAAHVISGGRPAGFKAVLGIHIGAYAHIFATAAGLTILLQSVPALFSLLKFGGATYLIWLGVRMIFQGRRPAAYSTISGEKDTRISQSILVELLNPKTALFFLAYLPQFADPAASFPIWLQLAILGLIVNCLFTIADLVVVYAASGITTKLENSRSFQRIAQRIGGTILIGMGTDLILRKQ